MEVDGEADDEDSDASLPEDGDTTPMVRSRSGGGAGRRRSPPPVSGRPEPSRDLIHQHHGLKGVLISLLLGPGEGADAKYDRALPYIHSSGLRSWRSDAVLDYVAPSDADIAQHVEEAEQRDASSARSRSTATPPLALLKKPTHPLRSSELALARPHPDAFYCPKRCCWRVATPWPTAETQSRKGSCVDPRPEALNDPDKLMAHHLVFVPAVVDPRYILRVPTEETEGAAGAEQGDSAEALGLPTFAPALPAGVPAIPHATDPEQFWDLYVCSRCSLSVVASRPDVGACPGMIRRELVERMENDLNDPKWTSTPGVKADPLARRLKAWSTLNHLIGNLLMRGSKRPVRLSSLQRRVPWTPAVEEIFCRVLGFETKLDTAEEHKGETLVSPPHEGQTTGSPLLLAYRARLCRLWIETSIHVAQLELSTQNKSTDPRAPLALVSARPRLVGIFGGQDLPVARGLRISSEADMRDQSMACATLGCIAVDTDEYVSQAFHAALALRASDGPVMLDALHTMAVARNSELLYMVEGQMRSQGLYSATDVANAYRQLGIDSSERPFVSETDVSDAFTRALEAASTDERRKEVVSALRLISREAESAFYDAVLASMAEPEAKESTLSEAYRALNLDAGEAANVPDEMLIPVFEAGVAESPALVDKLKASLVVIARERKSVQLDRYIANGGKASNEYEEQPVALDRPVGLQNIGNTCFLNSLLQYLFSIRELREVILRHSEFAEDTPPEHAEAVKQVGIRKVSAWEVERGKRFVSLLSDLFNSLIHAPTASVKPEYELAKLALDRDEQAPASTKPTEEAKSTVLGKRKTSPADADAMQVDSEVPSAAPAGEGLGAAQAAAADPSTASAIETADGVTEIRVDGDEAAPPPLPPRPPAAAGPAEAKVDFSTMLFGKQNDMPECMDEICFKIDMAMNAVKLASAYATGDDDIGLDVGLSKRLFEGKSRVTLEADADGPIRAQEDLFSHLLVVVSGEGRDLYDGLSITFGTERIEVDGKPAVRRVGVLELPPVLQIQLQRSQFDRKTARAFKNNAWMRFDQTLAMDRFLAPDPQDEAAVRRWRESEELQRELEAVLTRKDVVDRQLGPTPRGADIATKLKLVADWLPRFAELVGPDEAGADLGELTRSRALAAEAERVTAEQTRLAERVVELKRSIERIWADHRAHEYELVSVFMHNGDVNHGHYWLYQRAFPDRWIKYNDNYVTDASADTFLADSTGTQQNPYFFAYVRKDRRDLIDTVHRSLPNP